jgi:hypothetical protein
LPVLASDASFTSLLVPIRQEYSHCDCQRQDPLILNYRRKTLPPSSRMVDLSRLGLSLPSWHMTALMTRRTAEHRPRHDGRLMTGEPFPRLSRVRRADQFPVASSAWLVGLGKSCQCSVPCQPSSACPGHI